MQFYRATFYPFLPPNAQEEEKSKRHLDSARIKPSYQLIASRLTVPVVL